LKSLKMKDIISVESSDILRQLKTSLEVIVLIAVILKRPNCASRGLLTFWLRIITHSK